MMRGFTGDWWVVGGRAIGAFTGVPRPLEDIDIALLRADLAEFRVRHRPAASAMRPHRGSSTRCSTPAIAEGGSTGGGRRW